MSNQPSKPAQPTAPQINREIRKLNTALDALIELEGSLTFPQGLPAATCETLRVLRERRSRWQEMNWGEEAA